MALARWLRHDIGPLTLAASRFLIASAIYTLLLQSRREEERQVGGDGWLLLIMGLCGVTLFGPTLYLGLRYTTTVNATLINGLGPLITGFLATLLIGEPMSSRQIGGAVAAILGVIALISGGTLAFWRAASLNIGDLIMLGAILLWSLYSVISRRATRNRSALSATAFSAFLGLPLLVLAALWETRILPVNVRLEIVLAVLYIGLVPTVVGFLSWNEGIRRLGSSGAMVFYNTLPLYGALLGFLFLGETISPAHLVGGGLIIAGGLWAAGIGRQSTHRGETDSPALGKNSKDIG
jgi:drug/metabolite transporter (DMT)-like permease